MSNLGKKVKGVTSSRIGQEDIPIKELRPKRSAAPASVLGYGNDQGTKIPETEPSKWDYDKMDILIEVTPVQAHDVHRSASDPHQQSPFSLYTDDVNKPGAANGNKLDGKRTSPEKSIPESFDNPGYKKDSDDKNEYTPEFPEAENLDEVRYESPPPPSEDEYKKSPKEVKETKQEHPSPEAYHKTTREFAVVHTAIDLYAPKRQDARIKPETEDVLRGESEDKTRDRIPTLGDSTKSLNDSEASFKSYGNRKTPITSKQDSKMHAVMWLDSETVKKKKAKIFGSPDDNTDGAGCCGWVLYIFSVLIIIVTLPFSLIFCIKVVQEYERAVIFRLGRLPSGGAKGPGIFFIIPCIESYTKIDLRTVSFDVPPQEVLTKDSVTVSVDAVVYYRVSNPTVSVANVENAHHSTRLLAQTTLRNILGTKNMSEILSDRESISQGMQSTLDEATDRWGIKVERVEIKDVRLPVQLQRAMAAEAEAAREARAKVIAAEGEQKASRALKEAADVMSHSPAALQLRYLQTLSSISSEKNSTIIFPLPIDLLKNFMDKK